MKMKSKLSIRLSHKQSRNKFEYPQSISTPTTYEKVHGWKTDRARNNAISPNTYRNNTVIEKRLNDTGEH